MTQAIVNGKKQDIIITSSFKNSEFDKLEKKLPYSVLEYLFVICCYVDLTLIL